MLGEARTDDDRGKSKLAKYRLDLKAVEEAQKKAFDDAEVTVERVLRKCAVIAFRDPGRD